MSEPIKVRAHYSEDSGQEGWAFGVTLTKTSKRTGAVSHWLVVPGSDFGTTLYATADEAEKALDQRFEEPGDAWEIRRVRAVWRYGRNWFEILDDQPEPAAASEPVEYEYRVMYRHYDGTEVEWGADLSAETAREQLDRRANDDREWWIERRPVAAWTRVQES